jgi:hypothetical protein
MSTILWMLALSSIFWIGARLLWPAASLETGLGVAGPLLVACGAWVVMERTHARGAEALTAAMIAAFGVKLVVFGAYLAVVLGVLKLQPLPFVAAFAGTFITLHLTEAYFLRRLLVRPRRAGL